MVVSLTIAFEMRIALLARARRVTALMVRVKLPSNSYDLPDLRQSLKI